jgi:hypothetical protein
MIRRCVIKLGDEPQLEAPLHVETVQELISYVLGFYASLFAGSEVQYPDQSRPKFLYTVLKDGYYVPLASGRKDQAEIDLETLQIEPTERALLDHGTYNDPHAWKLMTGMFLAILEDN